MLFLQCCNRVDYSVAHKLSGIMCINKGNQKDYIVCRVDVTMIGWIIVNY